MRRVLMTVVLLFVAANLAFFGYVRFAPLDPAQWREDPAATPGRSTPNWALAAPAEIPTQTPPTRDAPVYATDPAGLLAALDAVAQADGRVEVLTADGVERTYVQRSALMAYPDVVSAKVVDLGPGDAGARATLALYSRSIYGVSDLGVNGARLDRWITALDAQLERVR